MNYDASPGGRFSAPFVLATLVVLAVFGTACGKRAVVEQSSQSGFDVEARETSSTSTSLRLEGNEPEDLMRAASRAAGEGDFAAAISIYRDLSQAPSVPEAIREEALFRLGMAHGDVRNGGRDYGQAVAALDRFLEQYPESSYREQAEANREKFEETLAREGERP